MLLRPALVKTLNHGQRYGGAKVLCETNSLYLNHKYAVYFLLAAIESVVLYDFLCFFFPQQL